MLEPISPQEVTAVKESAKPLTRAERKAQVNRENGKKGGRPPGAKSLEARAAEQIYREFMLSHLEPLLKAKIAIALGHYKAVTIGKGKNKRVVDAYLTDPSGGNIEDIFNRLLGKPKDGSMEEVSRSIAEVGSAIRQLLTKKK